jgi:2-C-methyl-D-erythritol 4-phosphate cytidylyltransferase / 2-C-methyl-D-erythritol 2,4-cyclodiphosphate synthase
VNERIAAVIVAAGQSTRFGGPKILTTIADVPVIIRTLRSIRAVPGWQSIVLVVNPAIRDSVRDLVDREPGNTEITIIEGGELRQDSVWAGIEAVGNVDIVVIHDGARPLVTPQLIESTITAVRDGADAAIAAVLVTDTLKRKSGKAIETVDRTDLWRSQTPQAFRMTTLRTSLAEARRRDLTLTDESMAIELTGGQVTLVPGDEKNLKLTNPGDAHLMEAILHGDQMRANTAPRTGIGYDVHRLVPGRRLMLGGLEIPFDHGLDGHSDADVLLHAIADAILGACAQGDIGRHFPPSDAAYRDISSLVLLERVNEIVAAQGFRVVNIDATIITEAPKIGPYAEQMQKTIGVALGVETSAISVKATTNEGLGFAGRREGIAALAIATVQLAI